jgi:hypothetical protein
MVDNTSQMRPGSQWPGVAKMLTYKTVASKDTNTNGMYSVGSRYQAMRNDDTEDLELVVLNFRVSEFATAI